MGVEYDGAGFHGWQIQLGVRSVQELLEQAVSKVADGPIRVHCAGRTDTGVHGIGQVVHFDTDAQRTPRSWILGTNTNLPPDINVSWAQAVTADFHARFSAISRDYRYLIINRATRSSLMHDRAVWVHRPLDEARMQEAAQLLVGTHDFNSYRALRCQAQSPIRTVTRIDVRRDTDRVTIDISANAFLHHMVRNIAGVLMAIGRGDKPVSWSREVLEHRDRTQGGVTAPPNGLYLIRVGYPDHFGIPTSMRKQPAKGI